jgi:hypothetical protein
MGSSNQHDDDIFQLALDRGTPFEYQRRAAMDAELSSLINVPTGAGKASAEV